MHDSSNAVGRSGRHMFTGRDRLHLGAGGWREMTAGGAGGGNRTHKAVRPLDFEPSASASSATPARCTEYTAGDWDVESRVRADRDPRRWRSTRGGATLPRRGKCRPRLTALLVPHIIRAFPVRFRPRPSVTFCP